MPHLLTSHWLCVSETTVWALMNHTIDICQEGTGLVRIGPVLSDVEKVSLNNQPVTQIMQRPIGPGIPYTRERNVISILLNLAESTFAEKRSKSLFESLFVLRSGLPQSSPPSRCTDQQLFTHFSSLSMYVHVGMNEISL